MNLESEVIMCNGWTSGKGGESFSGLEHRFMCGCNDKDLMRPRDGPEGRTEEKVG